LNVVAVSLAGANAASEAAGRLLVRFGLKERIGKMVRRRAIH
jgi:hypothetical protein